MILLLLLIPVIYLSLFLPFECDTGDSVMHYFFAHYAFQSPILFFDHWAKPFFTLLASPFAWFGFGGMKLFNGLIGLLSALTAYLLAKKLGLRFPRVAILLVMCSPDYFVNLFSGYTEPLFGFMLILSVYLIVIKKAPLATVLVSFLPFVRSEGLIICVVFAFYFILVRQYRLLLYLAAGHIVYSLAGLMVGKSLLWVFTDIPYSVISGYGHGTFFSYTQSLLLTLGVPLFVLCLAGIVLLTIGLFTGKVNPVREFRLEVQVLVLGSFMAYFIFHTLSWGLGMFGSMGLGRIMCALVPLQGVISLIALNYILSIFSAGYEKPGIIFIALLLGYIIIFPFLHNPASFNFNKNFRRSPEMTLMHQIAEDLEKSDPGKFLYYSSPYMSYALDINHFDSSLHSSFSMRKAENKTRPNSILIWDSWFSVVEEQTDSTSLLSDPGLKLLSRYKSPGNPNSSVFLVFRHK